MEICGLAVHRIVATAFHGEPPSPDHVVDHIDTNRKNNRVENLRWVTRLENLTENPKTLGRIEKKWGSIEGMLQDPRRAERADPLTNRPWMRQIVEEEVTDFASLTPLAIQRRWRTPTEFVSCPQDVDGEPLKRYLERLQVGSVFSRNTFGESTVERAELSGPLLSVITRSHKDAVKGWAVAGITLEEGMFIHSSHGTYFTLEGAEKTHCGLVGKLWWGGDTFDDYC
jgi:hypothetical protein